MAKPVVEYVIHAQVRDIRPLITRTFKMPGRCKVSQLHHVLQILFGWQDYHLHQFTIDVQIYGDLDVLQDDDFDGTYEEALDEKVTRLDAVLYEGLRFTYEYDFGDSWVVELTVRKMLSAPEGTAITCLEGKRAGPPEDCGGVSGYQEMAHTLAHPRSEDYEAMRTWVGPKFDATRFDLDQANRALARRFPGGRSAATPRPHTDPQPYDPSLGPARLEHYRLDKLNLRQQMVVALLEGPMSMEDLAERLQRAGITLPHGVESLRKAWRLQPPVRRRVDGRLEVDTDHPEFKHAFYLMDDAPPKKPVESPPSPPRAPLGVDSPVSLTWEELETPGRCGAQWPWGWSVRRKIIMILDAGGGLPASHDALRRDLARLGQRAPDVLSHSSFRGTAFRKADNGTYGLTTTDAEVIEVRKLFRTWWATHQLDALRRQEQQARVVELSEEAKRKRADEAARFQAARRAVVRIYHHGEDACGCVLWLADMRAQYFLPGARPALRETLRTIEIVFGLDPRSDFELLGLEPEGQRLIDLSPPFRSASVHGRQFHFTVAEAIAMTIPTTPPLASPEEAERLWLHGERELLARRAEHDARIIHSWWRHGLEHGCVHRKVDGLLDDPFFVHWDFGHEDISWWRRGSAPSPESDGAS